MSTPSGIDTPRAPRRAWYREPWVWFLLGIPGSAVLMGVVMLTLAIESDDGLVADDYYEQGLEINRSLERDARAARLALEASVDLDPGTGTATARVSGGPEFVAPQRVTLRLLHATRAGEDVVVELHRVGEARYAGALPPPASAAHERGRWHVQLETPRWRLSARLQGAASGIVTLRPGAAAR